jgi:8-oxo-dGTP diphosphatase
VSDRLEEPPPTRPFVAAGALFLNDAGEVLLVRPTYQPGWDIPGGYVHTGESPLAACQREIREELGVDLPVGRLLVIDWAPHPEEGDKLLFVFDGGTVTDNQRASFTLALDEIAEAAHHPGSLLSQVVSARLVRRITAAIAAIQDGSTVYLHDGNWPPR